MIKIAYYISSQSDNMILRTTLAALFSFWHLLPSSLSGSPAILKFALGRSLCGMRIAPDQFQRLVRAAWSL